MKVSRTKYKRTTPKTTTEHSAWNVELSLSFDGLIKLIKCIFGILYMDRSCYVSV
jgi:hypothetical protein